MFGDTCGASRNFMFFSPRYYTTTKCSVLFALQFGVFVRAACILIYVGCGNNVLIKYTYVEPYALHSCNRFEINIRKSVLRAVGHLFAN